MVLARLLLVLVALGCLAWKPVHAAECLTCPVKDDDCLCAGFGPLTMCSLYTELGTYTYSIASFSTSTTDGYQQHAETFGSGFAVATIDTMAENQCVQELVQRAMLGTRTTPVAIGRELVFDEDTFSWTTGLCFNNWENGEPNNRGGNEFCAVMYDDGFWNDLACAKAVAYVLEFSPAPGDLFCDCCAPPTPPTPPPPTPPPPTPPPPTPPPPTPPPPTPSLPMTCPTDDDCVCSGFGPSGSRCVLMTEDGNITYTIAKTETKPSSFMEIFDDAFDKGGLPAAIHLGPENTCIARVLARARMGTSTTGVAIGLGRIGGPQGNFMWFSDDDLCYTNWDYGEPNHRDNLEYCVVMYEDGFWNDIRCSHVAAYILEVTDVSAQRLCECV